MILLICIIVNISRLILIMEDLIRMSKVNGTVKWFNSERGKI